jgi:hypothetical protein
MDQQVFLVKNLDNMEEVEILEESDANGIDFIVQQVIMSVLDYIK